MEKQIAKTIKEVTEKNLYIPSVLSSIDEFEKVRTYLYDILKSGFEVKELRTAIMHISFNPKVDNKVYPIQIRHLYYNLLLWFPIIELNQSNDIDGTFIVTDYTAKGREKFYNECIITRYRHLVENETLNEIILESLYYQQSIAKDFNGIMGATMNVVDYAKLYIRNAQFRDLVETELDPNEQPAVVEKELDNKLSSLLQILKTEPNALNVTLNAGNNVKAKQLSEFFISVGYKSTVDGNTIPIPISSNFIKGMGTITEHYLESNSAIKALLANFESMGNSGYWSKNLLMLCSGIKIHPTIKDCNSIRPLTVEVKSQKHLNILDGQYRVGFGGKRVMISKSDKFLIGKKIRIKSPITCGCEDGYICEACYGKLSSINAGMGVGALAAAKLTEPISQSVLSTKHLNTTDSNVLKFSEGFSRFFDLNSNEIALRIETEELLKNWEFVVNTNSIEKMSENDDELDINEFIDSFDLVNIKNGEIINIKEEEGNKLYLSSELNKYINNNFDTIVKEDECIHINLSEMSNIIKLVEKTEEDMNDEISDNPRLFIMQIANNEGTKTFFEIMNLFDYYKGREEETIEWFYQRFIDLLVKAGLTSHPAVFSQILVKPLLRKQSNILEYPNFNGMKSSEDYRLLNVEQALVKNPSVLIGLSSMSLESQMKNVLTFKKTGSGTLDPLFRKNLY